MRRGYQSMCVRVFRQLFGGLALQYLNLSKPQNKRVEVASVPSKPSSTSNVIKRDGQYVAYANGIVRDTKAGLEWVAGPDKDTDWNEARSWVQSLNLDDGG